MIGLLRGACLGFALLLLCVAGQPASAQEDDLAALERQFATTFNAGDYAASIPLAERVLAATKARHGERHAETIGAMSNLARALRRTERRAEAEPILRQVIALDEAVLGASHDDLASDLAELGGLLLDTQRHVEAEALYRRAVAIVESAASVNHAQLADHLLGLGRVLRVGARAGEAETVLRRGLAEAEASTGPDSAAVADHLTVLAAALYAVSRNAEAEALQRRALAILEARFGRDSPDVAVGLANLAQFVLARGARAEAEQMVRQALAIGEARFGPNASQVAGHLGNLAAVLSSSGRLGDAEPLIRRALAIEEATKGPDDQRVAVQLNNLANVLMNTGRIVEAEAPLRRSIAISEKALGANHPSVASSLGNLSYVQRVLNPKADTEPLLRRALAIMESSFGSSHPSVAKALADLASYLKDTGRKDEAEAMLRRAVAIYDETLGPENAAITYILYDLARLLAERGNWAGALPFIRRAVALRSADIARNSAGSPDTARRLAAFASAEYRFHVYALSKAGPPDRAGFDEGFQSAQRAGASVTAVSMALASARFTAGSGPLADLVRTAQDINVRLRAANDALPEAIAKGDNEATARARAAEASLTPEFEAVSARLAREFPDYAALTRSEPLSLEAAQKLLAPKEALVQFLDIEAAGELPEIGFAWVITKTAARWIPLRYGALGLRAGTAIMRCGLDASSWAETEVTDAANGAAPGVRVTRRQRCKAALGVESTEDEVPPFDLTRAHEFYVALFGGVEDLIKDKQLLIVPSGALSGLPFQTLVTAKPKRRLAREGKDFAGVAWLGLRNAVTVLPSVASLQALRGGPRPSAAPEPFVGFGNPLLAGPYGTDNSAWSRQDCAAIRVASAARGASLARRRPEFTRGTGAGAVTGVDMLRAQWPLPETANELCAVAATLGAKPAVVHLGEGATEAGVKQLSASGALARAKVVHFATHGLTAAETASVIGTVAEPALMLTPPRTATSEDDGLLTASEVTQLKLDADWVLLSACNTASASASGGEDLSGLARAFFYAGARTLLVSHWYVDSQATVLLIGKVFAALKADPRIGRAEALRRAMSAMIAEGRGRQHPAKWAPFVVVGEGGAPSPRSR